MPMPSLPLFPFLLPFSLPSLLSSTGPYFVEYFDQPSSAELGTMVAVLEIVRTSQSIPLRLKAD